MKVLRATALVVAGSALVLLLGIAMLHTIVELMEYHYQQN